MKTSQLKSADVKRKWVVVDASEATLGRVSTTIAARLIGKYQPQFSPHVDSGDHVVVVNAANIKFTGDKATSKKYYRHSQHPGSLKTLTLEQKLKKNPAEVVELAVKGMLPKNKLSSGRMNRLHVYAGEAHKHEPQQPTKIEVIR